MISFKTNPFSYLVSGLAIVIALVCVQVLTLSLTHHQTNQRLSATTQSTITSPVKTWQKIINQQNNPVQIAIYDASSSQEYATSNTKQTMKTASTIKVLILATLLNKYQGKLTTTQKSLAKGMIEDSNNSDTNSILNTYVSHAELQKQAKKLGMTHTTINTHWYLSETTAKDQIKLLNQIFVNQHSKIKNRQYIKSLMNHINTNQNWGVSAGSSKFYLKNGWTINDNGTWIVNSIGYIPTKTGGYTIAIYTDNNSYATGVKLIERLAKATYKLMH